MDGYIKSKKVRTSVNNTIKREMCNYVIENRAHTLFSKIKLIKKIFNHEAKHQVARSEKFINRRKALN